jgi:hypothetical protein
LLNILSEIAWCAERNPNSEALIGAEVKEKDATEDVKQDP